MESFEDLLAAQQRTAEQIESIIRNYKKDSSTRKTKRYYLERLHRLETAWLEFESTDNKIRCLSNLPLQHQYFTDQYLRISGDTIKYKELFESESKRVPIPIVTPSIQKFKETEGTSTYEGASTQQEGREHDDIAIKVLRNQRALTRVLRRTIDEVMAQDIREESYCHNKLSLIEKYMHDFSRNNETLWQLTNDEQIDGYTLDDFYKMQAEVHNIQCLLQGNVNSSSEGTPRIVIRNEHSQTQLPKIQIPKFSGSYLQWVGFKDLYTQLIHNTTMSEVEKMFYLTTHLADEPKNLVKHLTISSTNYQIAWNILVDRYDNKRLIVTTLLNNLMSHPPMKIETAQGLKAIHDITKECTHGLSAQGLPVDQWDAIMVHILLKKLDYSTQTLFEQSLNDNKSLVSLNELLRFIEHRFQALETRGKSYQSGGAKDKAKIITAATSTQNCKVCGATGHPIYYCERFLKMSPAERLQWTQKKRLCVNCFKSDHASKACTSRSCLKCTKKHNTLLHLELSKGNTSSETAKGDQKLQNPAAVSNKNTPIVAATNKQLIGNNYVLLATARVKLIGANGRTCIFRALLDSGSQVNLVTNRVLNKLSLDSSDSSLCIEGIGRKVHNISRRINIELHACSGNYATRIEAFVLPNIVSPQPTNSFDISDWDLPENINLADPWFNQMDKIDILIGAEFYHQLMRPQQIKINRKLPILQNTTLGWVVTGKLQENNNNLATCAVFTPEEQTTNQLIENFWKLEDTGNTERALSLAEKQCEDHFTQNVDRNEDGRFVVRLPFAENPSVLGDSKTMAFNRFLALEKRLNRNPELRAEYNKFMQEYDSLGHMEEIKEDDIPDQHYVMPHHCVLKPDSSTTKLRVVFDASAKTSSGPSLNDIIHAGPTVQSELFSVLLRFRMHRIVFTADIEKMYRQIQVNEADQMFQLIIWRYNKHQDIKYYRLKTVTYGTSSAPYLATKCLQYLAIQNAEKYPQGAAVLRDDFYVDDCLSGANTINTALESQQQLNSLLKEAGFKLRKWCSNHPQLLRGIAPEDQEINLDLDETSDRTIKTLGLIWLPKSDKLCGRTQQPTEKGVTKRIVSSELAKIFDPLGLFGPVVVRAKIFLQKLWQLPISWDDELPMNLQNEWNKFRTNIKALNNIKIDRYVLKPGETVSTQIHTFVDASEQAYGTAIYIRSTYKDKTILTRLICSKSRVAPIKKQTLPRLELCAAVLGVELTNRVKQDLRLQNTATFFWSDSKIVLAWINSSAASFHTFVANRIARIQSLSDPTQWRHVSSKENPADAISRGLEPEQLSRHSMWFYGPLFLSGQRSEWTSISSQVIDITCNEERKMTKHVLTISTSQPKFADIINRINHQNSIKTLQHTIGYVLRFIKNSKITKVCRPTQKALNAHEMEEAMNIIIRSIQAAEFGEELERLSHQTPVHKSSPLASLNPFLDEHQIMRVGGRLEQSTLAFKAKHPAILSHNHLLTKLLMHMLHEENRHCGPQALLAASRAQFWITNGKTLARSTVHKCIRCTKAKPVLFKQLMGNLPADRVTPARPFITTGVDYFGPIWIHHKIRGKRPDKAYIAVFCCFATKAIHMEVASNLSTEAFIGALRRFISRRGHCQTLYCDNATNFVGANNKIAELREAIYSQSAQEKITRICSQQSINFKFIPPRAPHFGGLWEAAVKSAKHLLLRSVSAASLTYEELETIVIEIEAILNSRPLIPLSSNYDDFQALTPGHFLVGEPLTSAVDVNAQPPKISLDTRWKITSEIKHKFWKEWTEKYLHELQQRGKWKSPSPNVIEGMLVIIKEDNTPVLQWPLGRISRIYKGDDGLIRVCDVKTAKGTFKRPIHRLAPLFNDSHIEYSEYDKSTSQKRRHSPENDTIEPVRKIVPYASLGVFSTIFISLLLLPIILASPINVTEFSTNPGLYFEGVGSTKVVTASWKFIIYYDLTPIWDRNKVLEAGIMSFSKLCKQSIAPESCETLYLQLRRTWDNLSQESDFLTSRRHRRAALDIVGNMAHALFGVLDADYAEHMAQTIANVKQNEEYLHLLLKNQTSVIDSTINIIKQSENNTKVRFSELKKAIYHDLNIVRNESSNMRQIQNLMSLAIQLNTLASDLQRIETELIATLTHTTHGNISPLILTPSQLRSEIAKIKGHLPMGRTLPVEDTDLLELYKIMNIKGTIAQETVIFIIELPLVNQKHFELFKVTPIPTKMNDTPIVITTNIEYLAVNDHRDEYLTLSLLQFNKCTVVKTDIYLCTTLQFSVTRESSSYSCEIALFNNRTSPQCSFTSIRNKVSFIALHTINRWLYATLYPLELTAVCDSETIYLHLNNSGLLSIQPSCIIKGNILTIHGHETSITTLHNSYAMIGNITAIGKPSEVKRLLTPNVNLDTKVDELTSIQKQLADIKDLPREIRYPALHHPYISSLALLLSLLTIVILISWRLKCYKRHSMNLVSTAPQPALRQRNSEV